ncbi:MAG: O-antigen ligase family protein [Cyanobacteria bacterium P01_E01_bin.6]
MVETPNPPDQDTEPHHQPPSRLTSSPFRPSRFNQSLFITAIATLPYLFYGSMVGILVVLMRLIWEHRSPCLDRLTRPCVGAIALLLLLSAIDAYNPGEALLQLANFLPYMLLFAYLPSLLRSLETLENLAIALVLTSVPINLIAIGEFILKASFLPTPWQTMPWIQAIRDAPHKGRAMVMFDHPNVMASYLVVVLGLALGLLMMQLDYSYAHHRQMGSLSFQQPGASNLSAGGEHSSIDPLETDNPEIESPGANQSTGFSSGFSSSSLMLWAIGLLLVGIFCTGSRNGVAIALSQLFVFCITTRLNRKILGAIAAIVALGAAAVASLGLGTRQLGIFDLSNDPRVGVWAIATELIKERPWLGWGLGNFKFLYPPRLIDPAYQDIFHPHNIWLLLGAEAGIPVMILMNVLVGFICYRVVRVCLQGIRKTGRIFPTLPLEGAENHGAEPSERAIAIGYLLAFWGCLGFALLDVTFYDVRVNALNWTLLAALYAIPYAVKGIGENAGEMGKGKGEGEKA